MAMCTLEQSSFPDIVFSVNGLFLLFIYMAIILGNQHALSLSAKLKFHSEIRPFRIVEGTVKPQLFRWSFEVIQATYK